MCRLILVLIALLALCACASSRRDHALTDTLNAYASTVRWGDFRTALNFVDPDALAKHPLSNLDLARYQQLRVSDYNDDQGPRVTGENEVRQMVAINVVNIHTQTERSIVDQQVWHYDPQKKRWWLISGLPKIFGEE